MTAALPDREQLAERARKLYGSGMSLRQVGAALGIAHTTVRFMLAGGEPPHPRRHLRAIPDVPTGRAAQPLDVRPERAAIAYTAGRGWHMTEAPPGWFLDMLAEPD